MKRFLVYIIGIIISSGMLSLSAHSESYLKLHAAIKSSSLRAVKKYLDENGDKEIIENQTEIALLAREVKNLNKQKLIVDFSRLKKRGLAILTAKSGILSGMSFLLGIGFALNYHHSPSLPQKMLCARLGSISLLGALVCGALTKYLKNKSDNFRSVKKAFGDSCEIKHVIKQRNQNLLSQEANKPFYNS